MHKEELLAMGYDALLAMAGELGIKNLRKFKNNEDSIKELVFAIIDQQAMAKASAKLGRPEAADTISELIIELARGRQNC